MCAKLADKMRIKMLDEELEDIHLSFEGKIQGPISQKFLNDETFIQNKNSSFKNLLNEITSTEKSNLNLNQINQFEPNYFTEKEIKVNQNNSDSISFQIQKSLFNILFPEGFKLKNVDLDANLDPIDNKPKFNRISKIDEESGEDYNFDEELSLKGTFNGLINSIR